VDWLAKKHYLEVKLDFEKQKLSAHSIINIENRSNWHVPLLIALNKRAKVSRVLFNKEKVDFTEKVEKLDSRVLADYKVIDPRKNLAPREECILEVEYTGPIEDLGENILDETYIFRLENLWYPVNAKTPLLDYQAPQTTYELKVCTSPGYTALAAGELVKRKSTDGMEMHYFSLDKPSPLVLVVGKYHLISSDRIVCGVFTKHRECATEILNKAQSALNELEKLFQRLPYTAIYVVEGLEYTVHNLILIDYDILDKYYRKALDSYILEKTLLKLLAKCYWGGLVHVNKFSPGAFWINDSLPEYIAYTILKKKYPERTSAQLNKTISEYLAKTTEEEKPLAEIALEKIDSKIPQVAKARGLALHYMLNRFMREDYFKALSALLEKYSWKTVNIEKFTKYFTKHYPRTKWFFEDWLYSNALPLYKLKLVDLVNVANDWYLGFKIINEHLGRAPLDVVVKTEKDIVRRRVWVGSKDYKKVVFRLRSKPIEVLIDPEHKIIKHPLSETKLLLKEK